MNDAELVEAALREGPAAFGAIVERYQDAVFGIALARVRNFHDAQDVAQAVFVEAFERLGSLRDPRRLDGWLRTMTIGRSIDLLRQRRRCGKIDGEMIDGDIIDVRADEQVRRRELREEVMAAIERLTKAQRETVMLFYISGYSVDEVAAMCDVSPGTIKGRLHDARAKLKEVIGVVENVLRNESPKEDFAQRIFELLSKPARWEQRAAGAREIGIKGLDGFRRAYESPDSRLRTEAMHFVTSSPQMHGDEAVIDLLKRAIGDSNKKVRRAAVGNLLEMKVADERKRREFVPLVVPLLRDRSGRVRRNTAYYLLPWADQVPLEMASSALLDEPNADRAWPLRVLVKAIVDGKAKPKN